MMIHISKTFRLKSARLVIEQHLRYIKYSKSKFVFNVILSLLWFIIYSPPYFFITSSRHFFPDWKLLSMTANNGPRHCQGSSACYLLHAFLCLHFLRNITLRACITNITFPRLQNCNWLNKAVRMFVIICRSRNNKNLKPRH